MRHIETPPRSTDVAIEEEVIHFEQSQRKGMLERWDEMLNDYHAMDQARDLSRMGPAAYANKLKAKGKTAMEHIDALEDYVKLEKEAKHLLMKREVVTSKPNRAEIETELKSRIDEWATLLKEISEVRSLIR